MGSKSSRPNDDGRKNRPSESPPCVAETPSRTLSIHNDGSKNRNSELLPCVAETPPRTLNISCFGGNQPSDVEDVCRSDAHIDNFDSALHLRRSQAIHSIAVGVEGEGGSPLRGVTESVVEMMNHEAVKVILKSKKGVWKNTELTDLVDNYFEESLRMLDFCTALDACVKRAGHIESIVNAALRAFEEEHYAGECTGNSNYPRTLEELRNFMTATEPFTADFFRDFSSVYTKQLSALQKLQVNKGKIDKKMSKLKVWRLVTSVICAVALTSVLIIPVLAVAIVAPPLVTAIATSAAGPLGSIGSWSKLLWKKREKNLKKQKEIVNAVQTEGDGVIKYLDSVRARVDRFQTEIEAMSRNGSYATTMTVETSMEEIRKRAYALVKIIQELGELGEHADKYTQDTEMARALLERIINHPRG